MASKGGQASVPGVGTSTRHELGYRASDLRRRLQITLGVLWLLDAALQYQPYMFTRAFATQTLAPTAQGNPAPIAGSITWAAGLVADHPVATNAVFATAQLLLALGFFWRPTVKTALAASLVWSLAVWWLGEGFGGVLTGDANPLTGAPGAVILYALAAVLLWPRADHDEQRPTGLASWRRPARWGIRWPGCCGWCCGAAWPTSPCNQRTGWPTGHTTRSLGSPRANRPGWPAWITPSPTH